MDLQFTCGFLPGDTQHRRKTFLGLSGFSCWRVHALCSGLYQGSCLDGCGDEYENGSEGKDVAALRPSELASLHQQLTDRQGRAPARPFTDISPMPEVDPVAWAKIGGSRGHIGVNLSWKMKSFIQDINL